MSGGSGYVISRSALGKFVDFAKNASHQKCAAANSKAIEDVALGKCLLNAGAIAADSRDKELKVRYFPLNAFYALFANKLKTKFWLYLTAYYHIHAVGCLIL